MAKTINRSAFRILGGKCTRVRVFVLRPHILVKSRIKSGLTLANLTQNLIHQTNLNSFVHYFVANHRWNGKLHDWNASYRVYTEIINCHSSPLIVCHYFEMKWKRFTNRALIRSRQIAKKVCAKKWIHFRIIIYIFQ